MDVAAEERLLLIPMRGGMSKIFPVVGDSSGHGRLIHGNSVCHPEHDRRSGVSGGTAGEQANPAAALA